MAALPVAERWFERSQHPDGVTHLVEPHLGEHLLARPVRVEATGGTDAVDLEFDRGALMAPANLDAALGDGDISDYPFDSYQTIIHVHILTPDGAAVRASRG